MEDIALKSRGSRIAEEAAEWLMRLEEDPSEACREAFVGWLKHSPAHVNEFLLVTTAYRAMRGIDRGRSIDVQELMRRAGADVVELDTGNVIATARKARPSRWIAVAAAVSTAAIIGIWWPSNPNSTYATAVGEQRTIKLGEGSMIQLNTQSRIEVDFSERSRDVRLLQGEALFVVEADASRPFRVLTDTAVIQALGTEFNVYRRPEGTRVAVLTGKVRVFTEGASAATKDLASGEQADILNNGEVSMPAAPDVAKALAWRQRQLIFHSTPLAQIAAEFNRYNAMQLKIEGDTLAERRVTGVFNADTPEALLKFLETDERVEVERPPGADGALIIRERAGSS